MKNFDLSFTKIPIKTNKWSIGFTTGVNEEVVDLVEVVRLQQEHD